MPLNNIKIKRLDIYNFGPFYSDHHNLEFSMSNDQNVTVIEGVVGKGKTSIFQLLYWLIFGDEHKLQQIRNKNEHFHLKHLRTKKFQNAINKVAKELDTKFKVGGKLVFTNNIDGNKFLYELERYREYTKEDFSKDSIPLKPETIIFKKDGERINDLDKLRTLFSSKVRDFLFIHGESLDKSLEQVENVRKYAISLSDFPDIEEALYQINKGKKYINKKLEDETKEDKQLHKYHKKKNELEIKLENLKHDIQEYNQEKSVILSNISTIEEELSQLGDLDKDIELHNQYSKDLKTLRKRKNGKEKERSKVLKNNLPFIYLEDAMKGCLEDLKDKKKDEKWPNRITKEVIEDILNLETLLGVEWKPGYKDKVNNFKNELSKFGSEEITKICYRFENKIENELEKINQRKKRILNVDKELQQLIVEIDDKEDKIENLNIDRIEDEDKFNRQIEFKKLKRKNDKFNTELGNIKSKINLLNSKIETTKEEIKNTEKTIERYKTNINKQYGWDKGAKTIKEIYEIMEKIKNEFEKQIRKTVEEKTSYVMKKLVPDPETWKKIKIIALNEGKSKGWVLSAERKLMGTEVEVQNISTGQSNLLSLSYVVALHSSIGIKMPLIYDSMFVNLDEEERENVAKYLPKYYKNSQIIIFAKGQEVNQIVNLKKHIGRKYRVELSEDKGSTITPEFIKR